MPLVAHYCQRQAVAKLLTRLGAVRTPGLRWHGWCCSRLDLPPTATGRAVGGAPGRAERFPALGSTRSRGPGGGATVLVNGGGRRAQHPSDRSLQGEGGGARPQTPSRDQSDHREKKRNLQRGKSCGAIFGTQIFAPTPPAQQKNTVAGGAGRGQTARRKSRSNTPKGVEDPPQRCRLLWADMISKHPRMVCGHPVRWSWR